MSVSKSAALHPRSGRKNQFIFRLIDWLTAALLCALAAALLLFVVYTPVSIASSGVSDFNSGDLVFASRLGKHLFGFGRGDSVVVKAQEGAGVARHVRRVAAFSGEKVVVADGALYIDGSLLDESGYAEAFPAELRMSFIVPSDSLLLLPDLRSEMSAEAVMRCLSPLSDIVGEVRFTAFPPSRIRFFS